MCYLGTLVAGVGATFLPFVIMVTAHFFLIFLPFIAFGHLLRIPICIVHLCALSMCSALTKLLVLFMNPSRVIGIFFANCSMKGLLGQIPPRRALSIIFSSWLFAIRHSFSNRVRYAFRLSSSNYFMVTKYAGCCLLLLLAINWLKNYL